MNGPWPLVDANSTNQRESAFHSRQSVLSLRFGNLVQRVLGDLDGKGLVADARLAGQTRGELQAPRLVEEVVLLFGGGLERVEARAHDHVAGGARAALLAGVLDLAFGLTHTSRLGCQIKMTEELDGLTVSLPTATRNMMVDK